MIDDLRHLPVDERRGAIGFLRDVIGVLLGSGAILLLVVIALGWN